MLRLSQLRVVDEIDNGLAYYQLHVPRPRCAQALPPRWNEAPAPQRRWREVTRLHLPPFLRLGSWIGGDRDRQSQRGCRDAAARDSSAGVASRSRTTSTKFTGLGGELSLSDATGEADRATALALADAGQGRAIRTAGTNPIGRRSIGVYARLAATARACSICRATRPPSRLERLCDAARSW